MIKIDKQIKNRILFVLKKHDVSRAAVFGSYAREEATEESDIDLLVELPETQSLLDLVDLKLELLDKLGKSVDVVTYESLSPKIRDRVLSEMIEIL